jgi:hypothetical protein
MRLAAESHEHLQAFFREHFGDPKLQLPVIFFHRGALASFITRLFDIAAVTFGRRIIISTEMINFEEEGRLKVKGSLVAHEATHVLQYEREGYIRFFFSYLRGFWRALRAEGKWGNEARLTAYLAIPEERAARDVEDAYKAWRASGQLVVENRGTLDHAAD